VTEPTAVDSAARQWLMKRLSRGDLVAIGRPEELPMEAVADRARALRDKIVTDGNPNPLSDTEVANRVRNFLKEDLVRQLQSALDPSGWSPGSDPDSGFETFLRRADLPWIRPDVAFIPCPPVTMIGFNATTDLFAGPITLPSEGAEPGTKGPNGEPDRTATDAADIKQKLNDWAKKTLGDAGEWTYQVGQGDRLVFSGVVPWSKDLAALGEAAKNALGTWPETGFRKPTTNPEVKVEAREAGKVLITVKIPRAVAGGLATAAKDGFWPMAP